MSHTSITQTQLQQVQALYHSSPTYPAALWAALSNMGDQYATDACRAQRTSDVLWKHHDNIESSLGSVWGL